MKKQQRHQILLNWPESSGEFGYRVGWILCDEKNFPRARYWATWSLTKFDEFGKGSGYAYRLFARIERMAIPTEISINHSKYPKIQEYLDKAKLAFEQEGDLKGLARVCSDLGRLAFYCKEYNELYEYNLQALRFFQNIGDADGEANSFVNLGDAAIGQKDFNKAHKHYKDALAIIGDTDFDSVKAEVQRGPRGSCWVNQIPFHLVKSAVPSKMLTAWHNCRMKHLRVCISKQMHTKLKSY